jgi:hypothetical protein
MQSNVNIYLGEISAAATEFLARTNILATAELKYDERSSKVISLIQQLATLGHAGLLVAWNAINVSPVGVW